MDKPLRCVPGGLPWSLAWVSGLRGARHPPLGSGEPGRGRPWGISPVSHVGVSQELKGRVCELREREGGSGHAQVSQARLGLCGRACPGLNAPLPPRHIQDPASQRLTWNKSPKSVLVIKKIRDTSLLQPFKELCMYLMEASRQPHPRPPARPPCQQGSASGRGRQGCHSGGRCLVWGVAGSGAAPGTAACAAVTGLGPLSRSAGLSRTLPRAATVWPGLVCLPDCHLPSRRTWSCMWRRRFWKTPPSWVTTTLGP